MAHTLPATQLCSSLQSECCTTSSCNLSALMQYDAPATHICAAASCTVMQPL